MGLLVFICGGKEKGRWLWRWPFALTLDTVAGIVPSLVIFSFIYGRDIFFPEVVSWMIVLGVYGLITVFSASRQRP